MDSTLISVRVVNVDWYLSEESKLPVVRIFGSTSAGQRACLHLHGALPYFMIRPMEGDSPALFSRFEDPDSLSALIPQLEQAIESAMAASSGRPSAAPPSPQGPGKPSTAGAGQGGRGWRQQRVLARLEVVRGVPFYGYHAEEKLFIKVYINNPALTGKVASVLQAGHILSTRFQPYESHVPFLLQVFIDYNISGMSYIHLKNALFLQPLPEHSSVPPTRHGIFTSATVPPSLVANPPGQSATVQTHAEVTGHKRDSEIPTEEARINGTAWEKEVPPDLLHGISMSQLFSQSYSPTREPRPRPNERPTPKVTSSHAKPTTPVGSAQTRPSARWWERQTPTELEIAGTVDDVINPSLLAAGATEAGGKPMAVASLRELWDEEKERSRGAGGGSQLSAPPGLELADSQDLWEPPEGLLTQDMKDAVESLARNVLGRVPAGDEVECDRQPYSQPLSQPSAGDGDDQALSPDAELTPSGQDGLSQASVGVAGASSSPSNYLPKLDRTDGGAGDQGLLDMLAALRGSSSQGGEDGSHFSSPKGEKYTQSPSGPRSQDPIFTPASSVDLGEAVAATQKKQELEEEALDKQVALAAHTECHYDSDGSDNYHDTSDGRAATIDPAISTAATSPNAASPTGALSRRAPAIDPPPWSQRAASYPPWPQSRAGAVPERATSMPFWSQTSAEVTSTGLPKRLAGYRPSPVEPRGGGRQEKECEPGGNELESLLSQLSSRSADDRLHGTQTKSDGAGGMPKDPRRSPYEAPLAARSPSFEPSELADIICSQAEVEQDQVLRANAARDSMGVIEENGEGDDDLDQGNDNVDDDDNGDANEGDRTRIGQAGDDLHRLGGKGDQSWTRGPTQLRYDDDDEDNGRGTEPTSMVDVGEQETAMDQPFEEEERDEKEQEEKEQEEEKEEEEEEEKEEEEEEEEEKEEEDDEEEEEGEGEGEEESGIKSPLRLRGGAGSPRKRMRPPRPSRSATAPEPSRDYAETANPPTHAKRSAPWSGTPAKRQAPKPPGGLRRSSSMPGGRFRPPRPSTATSLAAAGTGTIAAGAVDRLSAEGTLGGGSGHGESAQSGSDAEGDDENSNKDERSQVVVPGWGSQGHHPVEYSESQLSFITTAQLRTSPTLARGRGRGAGIEGVRTLEVGTSKRQKLRGEGDRVCAVNRDIAGSAPIALHAPAAASGGGAVGDAACPTPRSPPAASASEPPPLDERTLEQKSMLGVNSGKEEKSALSPAIEMELAPESTQEVAEQHNAAGTDTGDAAVKSRWRGADARLRLAQERDISPPFSRRAQASGKGGDIEKRAGGSAGASCSFDAVDREEDADGEMQDAPGARSDQLGARTLQGPAATSCAISPSLDRMGDSLGIPRRRPEQSKATESSPRALDTSRLRITTAPSPTTAVTPGFPASTPTSSPALDFGRSPAFPMSAHSDQSDLPPLGQPSPALRNVASSGACSSDGRLGELDGEPENSSPSSRVFPASRSGLMTGSPMVESLSTLTPTILTPRSRPSGEMVLRPCEEAPDPRASVASLSRPGVPQMVHTEPFFSRKDDVPERPREFAGKVFRIPHKDDLQVFNTLPSRQLLHAYEQTAPPTAAPTVATADTAVAVAVASPPRGGNDGDASFESCTPHSDALGASWRTQASSGIGGVSASTSQPLERPSGGGGSYAEGCAETKGEDGGGWSGSGAPSWNDDDRRHGAPVALRGIDEWKREAAAAARTRRREHPVRRRLERVVELTPAISPPIRRVVAAWGRANPCSIRATRVVDDVDTPALRSTRNALGVLGGGGEADLTEGGSEELSMAADANTGALVPVAVAPRITVPRLTPVSQDGGGGVRPSPSPSFSEPLSTPPSEALGSVPSIGSEKHRRDRITADNRSTHAKLFTQGPHRAPYGSQISPTTQTPSSCLSGDDGAGRFAFGLGAGHPAAGPAAAATTAAAAAAGSQSSSLGLSGGIRGRGGGAKDGAGGDRLTVLSMEIHVQVGASRRPDPRRDPVHAICWRVKDAFTSAEHEVVETKSGVIVLPLSLRMRQVAANAGLSRSVSGEAGGGDGGEGGDGAVRNETCLKCGEVRDDDGRAFCTFEGGGGYLGQGVGEAGGAGRGTFSHGLGKGVEVLEVCSEAQVMQALVGVFCRHDPDFVAGWEVQGDSLGYLVERGLNMQPSLEMTRLLSRTPGREADKRNARDEWGMTHGSGIWLTGRTVLNMWRLMRSELKLCSYTLQSVAEHVLRKRVPSFSLQLRSRWFSGRNVAARSRALAEPLSRASACLSIMDKLDLLGRTSEMARLFGIDFFSVLSRGSQYRVEAVMLRVMKPRNFVALSPSRQQVAGQTAMESIPLVFEPRSRFYTSPVVVLDFQSLYPSMMIAYNLCYTTILGKFDPKTGGTSGNLGALPYPEENTAAALARAAEAHQTWQGERRGSSLTSSFTPSGRTPGAAAPSKKTSGKASPAQRGGGTQYFPTPSATGFSPPQPAGADGGRKCWNPRSVHVAPNTAGFCHPSLRVGILPLMLREILETRVMIKGAMRRAETAGQRVLARTLNARQFALKMISNVTYGYTAAGYSGRMPMAELADAIVESGRQTLIAAARTVENHKTWEASVVYGDTDSLFIELPGRSLEDAHRIGKDMAYTVSRMCPPDVVLKFEKVYLPCILASKKRYVGNMYESPKDLKPSFDAKGIETVRRDGCPLLVKMLEKVLRLLFTTKDLSQVKGYLYRQWTRILTDRAAVGDFIFAKEVRLGSYASDVYMPPSAIVASKAMANDPRAEPKYCERVPYVVVAGPAGARLMDLVVSPEQFLAEDSGLRLNGKYYITKVINPALDRALALLGVDVNAWYSDMPRPAPRVHRKTKSASTSAGQDSGGGGGGGFWGGAGVAFPGGQGNGKGKGKGARGRRACVITNFFISDRCSLCGEQCARSVCGKCAREPAANYTALSRLRESDLASQQLLELCRQCTGHPPSELFGTDSCGSLECPVFFERHRALHKSQDARELCDALGLLSA